MKIRYFLLISLCVANLWGTAQTKMSKAEREAARELDEALRMRIDSVKGEWNLIWGEGTAESMEVADQIAINELVSQISIDVESETETTVRNAQENGGASSSVVTTGGVRIGSNVSLSGVQRIVRPMGKHTYVLRYVAQEEIEKMYEARKAKAFDLMASATRAESQNKISDALRQYYWALKVLYSLPDEQKNELKSASGMMLTTELTETLNRWLDSIRVEAKTRETMEEEIQIGLNVTYCGKPVACCDFSYFDGSDWITASAKDGMGAVQIPANTKQLSLRIEYEFAQLQKIDPMVESVFKQKRSRIPFPKAGKRIEVAESAPVKTEITARQLAKEMINDTLSTCSKREVKDQASVLYPILNAMEKGNFSDIKKHFTENGWKWFEKLIQYGHASILERPQIQISAFEGGYLLRGIKASFAFKNNSKRFVEDLVFYVKDDLIESVQFGLEQGAMNDIAAHAMWNDTSRLVLINFLECYKTAYALERLDYLNAIFSDDALIIVGNKLPQTRYSEVRTDNQESFDHNRLTKGEYMENLRNVFDKQEYVNIQFEDAAVKKTNANKERYEILIKQNYYSTSYADKGYLYLLADISNPEQPIIHVRVWDEDKNNLMNYGEWNY